MWALISVWFQIKIHLILVTFVHLNFYTYELEAVYLMMMMMMMMIIIVLLFFCCFFYLWTHFYLEYFNISSVSDVHPRPSPLCRSIGFFQSNNGTHLDLFLSPRRPFVPFVQALRYVSLRCPSPPRYKWAFLKKASAATSLSRISAQYNGGEWIMEVCWNCHLCCGGDRNLRWIPNPVLLKSTHLSHTFAEEEYDQSFNLKKKRVHFNIYF